MASNLTSSSRSPPPTKDSSNLNYFSTLSTAKVQCLLDEQIESLSKPWKGTLQFPVHIATKKDFPCKLQFMWERSANATGFILDTRELRDHHSAVPCRDVPSKRACREDRMTTPKPSLGSLSTSEGALVSQVWPRNLPHSRLFSSSIQSK